MQARYLNHFIQFVIVVSILSLVLETEPVLANYTMLWNSIGLNLHQFADFHPLAVAFIFLASAHRNNLCRDFFSRILASPVHHKKNSVAFRD